MEFIVFILLGAILITYGWYQVHRRTVVPVIRIGKRALELTEDTTAAAAMSRVTKTCGRDQGGHHLGAGDGEGVSCQTLDVSASTGRVQAARGRKRVRNNEYR